jgi:hypothetical protein
MWGTRIVLNWESYEKPYVGHPPMRGAMDARTANGGHYNLIFNNCAQFVEGVLHAGGVSGVPHAEVFGPAILGGILWAEH